MVEKTVYVANDGKEFESEEECILHETCGIFSVVQAHIHLMSRHGVECFFNNWDEFVELLESAKSVYMNIDKDIDIDTLPQIDDFLKNYYGLYAYLPLRAGEYRWDSEEEKWISYQEDFEKFSYNWQYRRG